MKKVTKKVVKKTIKTQNKKRPIPAIFKPYLWSYDIKKMDLDTNRETLIENVVELGGMKVSNKLFDLYPRKTIREVVNKMRPGLHGPRSINYWKLILNK
jgi:hypothetical protein